MSSSQRIRGQLVHIHRLELSGAVKPSFMSGTDSVLSCYAGVLSGYYSRYSSVSVVEWKVNGLVHRQVNDQNKYKRFPSQRILLLG